MKVFLASSTRIARDNTSIPAFEKLAAQDRFRVHQLTDDATAADVILFVDCHQHHDDLLKALRRHPLVLRYPSKILVYNERDHPWCVFPGIYVSMPASRFDKQRQKAFSYHTVEHRFNLVRDSTPDLLYSFVGARSHKIRERVLSLQNPRGIVEASQVNFFDSAPSSENLEQQQRQKMRFVELFRRSKFVLCPRGMGTASFRLFEAMESGRVPVIISDEWMAPRGPDWESFSLRVLESQVENIPTLLQSCEARYPEMALRARQAYEDWFAPDVVFHRLIENCAELLQSSRATGNKKPLLDRQYLFVLFRVLVRRAKVAVKKLIYCRRAR